MSSKAKKMGMMFAMLGGKMPDIASLPEFYETIVRKKNKEHSAEYARTPYSRRLVMLPQCLRSTKNCRAKEEAAEYICQKCGACKIKDIVEKGEELDYLGVRILKGGSAVTRLIEELKPGAVLGIACTFEGALGILECERLGVAVQSVTLLKDGCADTDVALDEVIKMMEIFEE